VDQPLGMQPVHRVPVERLPRARTVVKPQPSKRQYSIVDPIGVDVHDRLTVQQDCDHATRPALSSMAPSCGARRMLTSVGWIGEPSHAWRSLEPITGAEVTVKATGGVHRVVGGGMSGRQGGVSGETRRRG
jgi:hypothetical protein